MNDYVANDPKQDPTGAATPRDGDEAGLGSESPQTLHMELQQARLELDKHRDEMLRARAELDNFRKRTQRDVEAAHKFGIERLVEAFLPVKDSMDLGFEAANNTSDVASLREGIGLTLKMFDSALEKVGVKAVNPLGEKFNPEQHQAVMLEPSTEHAPGTVLRVLQQGYLLNERLLRPAMVIVAKSPDEA